MKNINNMFVTNILDKNIIYYSILKLPYYEINISKRVFKVKYYLLLSTIIFSL